jgi:hypothetical protein
MTNFDFSQPINWITKFVSCSCLKSTRIDQINRLVRLESETNLLEFCELGSKNLAQVSNGTQKSFPFFHKKLFISTNTSVTNK